MIAIDTDAEAAAIARRAARRAGAAGDDAIAVAARRAYPAPPAAVWAALTEPDRLRRCFLPVSGDLRPGGAFQAEGNAGGVVRACDPPRALEVTWGDERSVVSLALADDGGWFSRPSPQFVNYRQLGNRFVVDSVLSRAALVSGVGSGKTRVTITREAKR